MFAEVWKSAWNLPVWLVSSVMLTTSEYRTKENISLNLIQLWWKSEVKIEFVSKMIIFFFDSFCYNYTWGQVTFLHVTLAKSLLKMKWYLGV